MNEDRKGTIERRKDGCIERMKENIDGIKG